MAESSFETEDMTFVTVLLIKGIYHHDMQKVGEGCRWIYAGETPFVEQIFACLNEYNEGTLTVEPREFTKRIGQVRREMYRFMGVRPQRIRPAHTA